MRLSREAWLLLALLALALAASLLYRPVTRAARIQDPAYAAVYEQAVERLPVLDAVRVRSERGHAAQRLRARPGFWIVEVLDAKRAREVFKYGQLLYLDRDALRSVDDRLAAGELPELPDAPDIERWFTDVNGPFECDVVLRDQRGVATIRDVLPDARLWGEPVARDLENQRRAPLTGALLAMLALSVLAHALRRDPQVRLEIRILAVVAPVLLLVLTGLDGVDAMTLFALAIVFAADRGASLWVGAAGLFFPALALKRIGVVFLVGWIVRRKWERPTLTPLAGPVLLRWAVFLAVCLGGVLAQPGGSSWPREVRTGQSVRFGGPADPGALLPEPADDPETRSLLKSIYQRADRLARKDGRFRAVAEAAAVTSLHLPRGIEARLRTVDGHEAIWRLDHDGTDPGPEWQSAELSRARGDRALRRHALWAALAAMALFGACCAKESRFDLCSWGGLVLGVAGLLWFKPDDLAPWAPLLAVAAVAPARMLWAGLIGAALVMPAALVPAAAAVAATSLLPSWAARRRSR